MVMLKSREELYARESLLPEVLEFAVAVGKITTSAIQKEFKISYPRAARLVDILEEEGFIEGMCNGPRKVLIPREEYCFAFNTDEEHLKEVAHIENTIQPVKGLVRMDELQLDKIKFFDEFDEAVSEETAKELNKTIFDILCKDALVNLSSEFLLDFLKKKEYKIKYIKFDFDNVSEIFRIEEKITAPVIYIVDVAKGSIIEILKQCNLLVKEGAIVMRKIKAEKSTLTILF